jgi:hypothetical protein
MQSSYQIGLKAMSNHGEDFHSPGRRDQERISEALRPETMERVSVANSQLCCRHCIGGEDSR